jgi:hypothetical protein
VTIAELKDHAARTLDHGIERLKRDGELMQMFHFVRRDGVLEVVMIDGAITNDENAKHQLGRRLKARVAAGDIEAVIHLSDMYWTSDMEPEKDKIRQALGMTVEQAGRAGFCTVHEGVMCLLESPILHQCAKQEYRRDGDRIELVGSPWVASDEDGSIQILPGRFNFFPYAANAGGRA